MTIYPGHVFPEFLEDGDTAYTIPWGIYECQEKFYIPKELSLSPNPSGTCTVPVTRLNGVLVIGEGYNKPNQCTDDWTGIEDSVEVTLHDA